MERETVHISGRRQNVSPVAGEGAPGPGRPWRGDAASGGRMRSFAAVAAALALIALGVGLFGLLSQRANSLVSGQPTPISTATASGSGQTPLPNAITITAQLPSGSRLASISLTSTTEGWLAGQVDGAEGTSGPPARVLLAHFDGKAWTYSKDSETFPGALLLSIAMASADEGWASGTRQNALGVAVGALLLHYSGGHWREAHLDFPAGFLGGVVRMTSADEGWLYGAVGLKDNPNRRTVLFHYANGSWALFSSVSGYADIDMLSATDGWAINWQTFAVLHYSGGTWQTVAHAPGQPLSIAMVSPGEGLIGGFDAKTQSSFLLHYDGHAWRPVTLPQVEFTEIDRVVMVSAMEGWAFGADHGTAHFALLAWHYSNGTWERENIAYDYAGGPAGISFPSPTEGWLTNSSRTLLHYTNGAWTLVNR